MITLRLTGCLWAAVLLCAVGSRAFGQAGAERQHMRGKLWENVANDGFIGSLGAWDYNTPLPLGLYPGFKGYSHPASGETKVFQDGWDNSNMHNFKSGVDIMVRSIVIPGLPPDYTPGLTGTEVFLSGLEQNSYGVENVRAPLDFRQNYLESAAYDPLMPEELITGTWNTNTGITVTRRSYAWGFPGYRDFIIYDYVFRNTGIMVSPMTGVVVPNFPSAVLSNVRFVFTSGIAVSTKSQINFHTDNDAHNWGSMAAGGFGYDPPTFHDYYMLSTDGTLAFSYNFNGGKEPVSWDTFTLKDMARVRQRFGNELQSPAAFGWQALWASPLSGTAPRTSPKPDVLRIDVNKGGTINGQAFSFETFRLGSGGPRKELFYTFASSPDLQVGLPNNGRRFNWYAYSYGPYTLAPGDSVRIIIAEVAGVMDYNDVIAGDPNGQFPDSTIAAIQRNAAAARNAVRWGLGASANGIPLAADVPEPPPAPVCRANNASAADTAVLAVSWDKSAEKAVILDQSGSVFYDGSTDLDGYRIYRSTDFQYVSDLDPPAFRGAAWTLVADIPRSSFAQYASPASDRYSYIDKGVTFGYQYGYYVAGYTLHPRTWTSANGTVVPDLPPMESGDYNRSIGVKAAAGPAYDLDVFVVPNPFVYGDAAHWFGPSLPYNVEFRKLPEVCTIRIYTINGDLVRVLQHAPDSNGNLSGTEAWNQISDSGILVSPGLYVFSVESRVPGKEGTMRGKFMIIR